MDRDGWHKNGLRPIWLASYPRSGNTFLRLLLEQVFGLPTYSKHCVEGENYHDPSADPLENASPLPPDWRRLIGKTPRAQPALIKTHSQPEDDSPAIYIVRDGGPAIDSYYRYCQSFETERPSLTAVITGACHFGNWSDHYRAWQPQTRPRTLFLRFEQLVRQPAEVISQLAGFLQRQPVSGAPPSFAELHAQFPDFFRRGSNRDFATEWSPVQLSLFNLLHGPVMCELGYRLPDSALPGPEAIYEIVQLAGSTFNRYTQQVWENTRLEARLARRWFR